MSENKTTWELDLDIGDAAGAMEQFKGTIAEIGEAGEQSFTKLVSVLGEVGLVVGVVGASFLALKETMDLVFEAEEIAAVNQQFDTLARNAGVAGEALKEGLVEASGGLVTEIDLLKAANKGLVEMNGTADQLPEIMTVARQATAVFGGDLMQNFDGITKAISSGNTRMLKHLGIVVDQQKAYKDYAASIGVAASELDAAGKSHAILNAVLEKAGTAFEGVNLDIKQGTNLWQETKVAFSEFGEAFTVFFGNVFGPTIVSALKSVKEFATDLKNMALANFGTETQKAAARVDELKASIEFAKKQIADYQKQIKEDTKGDFTQGLNLNITNQQKRIQSLSKELEGLTTKQEAEGARTIAAESKKNATVTKDDGVNHEIRLKASQKFQAEIDKLKETSLAEDLKNTQSTERADEIGAEQKKNLAQRTANELKKIETDMAGHAKQMQDMKALALAKSAADEEKIALSIFAKKEALLKKELAESRDRAQVEAANDKLEEAIDAEGDRKKAAALKLYANDKKRQAAEILAIERSTENQIAALGANLVKLEEDADQKEVQDAESAGEKISAAFRASSKQSADDLRDMGKFGSQAFSTLGSNAVDAFKAMGDGSKSAADAMKGFILNSVGQQAIASGTTMLLSGIWPPNPVAIAGGGALIAFGSALTSASGGATGGASTSAPSSAASSASSPVAPTGPDTSGTADAGPSTAAAGSPQHDVSVVVQGNMYSSNEAKAELIDLMRQGTDATGYKYQQVGSTG